MAEGAATPTAASRAGDQERRFDDVAVVMITRDEEDAIEHVLRSVEKAAPGAELVVVDGSRDATPEIAARCGARVIPEPKGGAAPALLCALQSSDRAIVVTIDADDTYPPEIIPALVELVRSGFDVAGTSRISLGRPASMPWPNYVANRMFNVLASIRARHRVLDVHSGQRAYRRSLIDAFEWRVDGLALPVDLLVWPALARYRVVEVPIEYRERIGHTKLLRLRGCTWTIRRIFRRCRQRSTTSGTCENSAR